MKRNLFTDDLITTILKEHEASALVPVQAHERGLSVEQFTAGRRSTGDCNLLKTEGLLRYRKRTYLLYHEEDLLALARKRIKVWRSRVQMLAPD